jgi:hypothetical protein
MHDDESEDGDENGFRNHEGCKRCLDAERGDCRDDASGRGIAHHRL